MAMLIAIGYTPEEIHGYVSELDFSMFTDRRNGSRPMPRLDVAIARFHLTKARDGVAALRRRHMYEGDALLKFLEDRLAAKGIRTFGDLKDLTLDPDHPERCYKLMVPVSDLTRREVVRLPWDYQTVYGLNPDEQSVAEAVRMGTAIPYLFKAGQITSALTGQTSMIVDGGLGWSFPLECFDRPDGLPARWPTIGIRTSDRPAANFVFPEPTSIADGIAAIVMTGTKGRLRIVGEAPHVSERTINIDTSFLRALDFTANTVTRDRLWEAGRAAAEQFVRTFDFKAFVARQAAIYRIALPDSGADGLT